MTPTQNITELLRGIQNKPSNTSALESLRASANKSSLADTARVKRWLGSPLSLQETVALLEEP